jgi:phenylpropionate dioxygenase-like ring-hydroxylating dioxygenase large terminal subunit
MNFPFAPQAVRPVTRKNVVRVLDAWYVACRSSDLGRARPLARTILGVPLALFRDARGLPAAVLDRCPHRNVPLSLGKVKNGELQCAYHGWRFDGAGKLRAVPGLPIVDSTSEATLAAPGRNARGYATREQDGYVWVWMDPSVHPTAEPFALEQVRWPSYLTVRQEVEVEGTLHSTLENILDVPHTAFLHGGLFRTEEKHHEITAHVRRTRGGVEAQFVGEPRPPGLAARILSPSGGLVEHWDRFIMPSVAQVEYRLGSENHIVTTSMCTPITETRTVMHTALSVRTRLPVKFFAFFAMPFAFQIVKQDKVILRAQTEVVDRFGTETFSSTAIDLLGPHILHLLKKAEARDLDSAIVRDETVKLMV